MTDQRHESPPESTASGAQPTGRNVFISSLGTSAYRPTRYGALDGEQRIEEQIHFVQQARLAGLKSAGVEMDRVVTLLTRSSDGKNYNAPPDGNSNAAHNACAAPGYKLYLDVLKELGFSDDQCVRVDFDDPNAPPALWKLFDAVTQQIERGDMIYVDVTYGFRAIPVLLMVALDYVCRVKGAILAQVTYGAFEVKGGDATPIFDLTPFLRLQRWTDAVVRAEADRKSVV